MSLPTGVRLGAYEILAAIGAGGMGEVYRARDRKLDRDVAIKILPEELATDPDRIARFEREAKTLAALNHPNIAQIYGFEESDGIRALVIEMVEGPTLADRIAQGPVPVEEALPVARQIADALEAAHERGIIHRDLKPANVKVRPDGTVKVLDFGLAKALEPRSGVGSDVTASSTMTSPAMTRIGVILGTAAYMSPEQARGQAVDKRSDIWAFGCVLFEMLTGRPAFAGATVAETIAAIVHLEPNWKELRQATPESIRRLLRRCLQKDLKRRLRDIGDARAEIDDALTTSGGRRDVREHREVSRRWIWGLAFILVALGLGVGWTIEHLQQPVADLRAARLTVNPPTGTEFRVAGETGGAAISPDGRLLAFVARYSNGVDKLWIRPLNSLAARELPGTDDARYPFWSPDSASLGFFAGGRLKRVEVAGGSPAVICEVASGRGGTWNEEGVVLFNAVNDGPLLKVSATGGTPVPVTTVDTAQGENSHRWPQFLPDGRRFIYFNRGKGIYLGSLDRPQEKIWLLNSTTNAIYAPPHGANELGHLFWVRDGTLIAQPFDAVASKVTGQPAMIAEGVALGAVGQSTVSISKDGTIVYSEVGVEHLRLSWYDRNGKQLAVFGQPERYVGLRISPDAKRVALAEVADIWQMEFARAIPTRVTFSGSVNNPVWSPDGQRIAYQKGSPPNLFSGSANGTGSEKRLIESRDTLVLRDWSPDGMFLLYSALSNDISSRAQPDLWLLPLTGDRQPFRFLKTPFREGAGQFSPDAAWIAYTSDESRRNEVYVQSFPSGQVKWTVSSNGGAWPRWRRDGRELFYVGLDSKVMSVEVRAVSGSLEFGTPTSLFTLPLTRGENDPYPYDVMPDGQRFLALVPASDAETPPLTVMFNWQGEQNQGVTVK